MRTYLLENGCVDGQRTEALIWFVAVLVAASPHRLSISRRRICTHLDDFFVFVCARRLEVMFFFQKRALTVVVSVSTVVVVVVVVVARIIVAAAVAAAVTVALIVVAVVTVVSVAVVAVVAVILVPMVLTGSCKEKGAPTEGQSYVLGLGHKYISPFISWT